MKTCIILVGLPGSGKSTYRKLLLDNCPSSFSVISTDDYVERKAEQENLTYREAWDKYMPAAVDQYTTKLIAARHADFVIIDQTNLTKRKRRYIQETLGKKFTYYAVVFSTPFETILARNEERKKVGRDIPMEVLTRMQESFQMPTTGERFAKIIQPGIDPNTVEISEGLFFQD